jgi:hypothetical protein
VTEQSNLNVQEASANATNVYASDLDENDLEDEKKDKKDKKNKHAEDGDSNLPDAQQTADANVEQVQEVEQVNSVAAGSAVAIAVGENTSATAVQMFDQSNINEQVGTAEALNVMMESAGMNVATASIDGGSDIVDQDSEDYPEPKDKKGEKPHDGDGVSQTAEASVTQY